MAKILGGGGGGGGGVTTASVFDIESHRPAYYQMGSRSSSSLGGGTVGLQVFALDASSAAKIGTDGIGLAHTMNAATSGGYRRNYENGAFRVDVAPRFRTRVHIEQITDIRMFVGLVDSDTVSEGGVDSDDPSRGYIGFQFSSARPDTNWQLIRKSSSGGTQTIVDTGIAGATGALAFDQNWTSSTTVELSILNATTREALYESGEISTNLISAGTDVWHFSYARPLTGSGTFTNYSFYMRPGTDT